MATSIAFTSNEEIDQFQAGDNTIEITGYVDGVETIKYVGKNNKPLLKFVINNGTGRRIRVLIWDEEAKTQQSKIINRQILHIQRGLYVPSNPTYFHKEDGLIPYEISLSRHSTLTTQGNYETDITIPHITETTIENCVNVQGKLSLKGYIKVDFAQISTGYSSFGSGAIADDVYKLRVHISNFQNATHLPKGTHIEVVGEIKRDKYDSIYLHVENMNNIKILDGKVLPAARLNAAIFSPKNVNVLKMTQMQVPVSDLISVDYCLHSMLKMAAMMNKIKKTNVVWIGLLLGLDSFLIWIVLLLL